jgi:hypothetical protein
VLSRVILTCCVDPFHRGKCDDIASGESGLHTWYGRDDLAAVKFVQDCRLSRIIETEDQNSNFLLAPEPDP